MRADIILVAGVLVFISSLISLRVGLSVAIIEIILGAIAGNFGVQPDDWMLYLASFGGILLTFLAGTEIDTKLMKEKFKESFLIGTFSFLLPFVVVFMYTYYVAGWNFQVRRVCSTLSSSPSLTFLDRLTAVSLTSATLPLASTSTAATTAPCTLSFLAWGV